MDDISLRNEFHRALDAVAPPAPWLTSHVREELRRRRHEAYPSRWGRPWFTLSLPRMSTPLVAGILILVLAIAAVGAFVAINLQVHRSIPIKTHSGPVSRMCSQGGTTLNIVGWSTTSPAELGIASPNLSVPSVAGLVKGGNSTCILDANHAWVTEATGNPNCPGAAPCAGPQIDHVVVLSTQDGGQTWQQDQAVPASGANLAVEVDFLDNLHGWLLTDSGYYSSPAYVRTLYATSDGGLHWNRLTSGMPIDGSALGTMAVGCAESGIMFLSSDQGWLTWNCSSSNGPAPAESAGPVVATTNDGGRTWAPLNLPGICGASPPVFSGSQGVLQSQCGVYWTADSGKTWTAGQALPAGVQIDLLDGATGFYFQEGAAGSDLYRTDDSGRSWTVVATGLFPGDVVDWYQFVNAKTGFANTSRSPATWKTTDGGKTWVLPAAYRSIGNVVCPLPWNPPAPGSVPVLVKMVSPTTGWAAGALRTTDGGSRWSSAGPQLSPGRSAGRDEFFMDGTHAWVAQAVGSPTACADHLVIFGTVNGGSSWQQQALINIKLPASTDTVSGDWSPTLDFVDGEHGWLLVTIRRPGGFGYASTDGPLYRTSDGGRHWTMVSSQPGSNDSRCRATSAIYFSSTTTGWLACNFGSVLVTHDGGATWTVQVLVSENCCQMSVPIFFDESHGMYFDSSSSVLLMTSDGGTTWSPRGLPLRSYYDCDGKFGPTTCTNESIPLVSFINPTEGWAAVATVSADGTVLTFGIEHTVDNGQTWMGLSATLPPAPSSAFPNSPTATLSFVDASDGFWWIPASQASGPIFARTIDGGHTWTVVQMKLN